MKIHFLPFVTLLLPLTVLANDFPTLERVDHVLTCMKKHGGQTVENLYACSCEVDAIAQEIPYDTYEEARTFEAYRRLPGEKGGIFRDSDEANRVEPKLVKARADAEKQCFIREHIVKKVTQTK